MAADLNYEVKFTADASKLKKGVVDTELAIKKITTTAKNADASTKGFLSNFSKGFTKHANIVGAGAAKIGKSIAGMFGPVGLALAAISLIITKVKDAINKYVQDIKDAQKASKDLSDINITLGTSYNTNEKELRKLSQSQKGFIEQMLVVVKTQKDLDQQLRLGLITLKEYKIALSENNKNAIVANDTLLRQEEDKLAANKYKIAQLEKELESSKNVAEFNDYAYLIDAKKVIQINDLKKEQAGLQKTIEDTTKAIEANTEANKSLNEESESDSEKEIRLWQEKLAITNQATIALQKQAEIEKQMNTGENATARLSIYQQELDALAAKKIELQKEGDYEGQIEKEMESQLVLTAKMVKHYTDASKIKEKEVKTQKELNDLSDDLWKQRIAEMRVDAEAITNTKEREAALNKVVEAETQYLAKQREQERNQLKLKLALEEYADVSDEVKERIIENFDAITASMLKVSKSNKTITETTPPLWENATNTERLGMATQAFSDFGNSILEITSGIADDQIAIIQEKMEAQLELINKQYEETMARLDEERNAALEAAGFIATTSAEGLEASMAAAKASGDEGLIYAEKRRQEELAINKKFNDLEKAAELKKAADEKAIQQKAKADAEELQYQSAMAGWAISLAQLPYQIISGIGQAISQFGPIAGPIVGGVVGVAMTAALIASKPKKPSGGGGGGSVSIPSISTEGTSTGGSFSASPMESPSTTSTTGTNIGGRTSIADSAVGAVHDVSNVPVNLSMDGVLIANGIIDLINRGQTIELKPV